MKKENQICLAVNASKASTGSAACNVSPTAIALATKLLSDSTALAKKAQASPAGVLDRATKLPNHDGRKHSRDSQTQSRTGERDSSSEETTLATQFSNDNTDKEAVPSMVQSVFGTLNARGTSQTAPAVGTTGVVLAQKRKVETLEAPGNEASDKLCANCRCTRGETPMWRKDQSSNVTLCNACGIYHRKHNVHRPIQGFGNRAPKPPARRAKMQISADVLADTEHARLALLSDVRPGSSARLADDREQVRSGTAGKVSLQHCAGALTASEAPSVAPDLSQLVWLLGMQQLQQWQSGANVAAACSNHTLRSSVSMPPPGAMLVQDNSGMKYVLTPL